MVDVLGVLALLGRHVVGRAHRDVALRQALGARDVEAGEAEVEHLGAAVGLHQHVVGLEVAVDDAARVRIRQRVGHLPEQLRQRARRGPGLVRVRAQRDAVDQLHRDPAVGARAATVEQAHHARVVELGHGGGLALEPLHVVGHHGERRREDLDRDRPTVLALRAAEHLAHAALADPLGDGEPVDRRKRRLRRSRAGSGGGGRRRAELAGGSGGGDGGLGDRSGHGGDCSSGSSRSRTGTRTRLFSGRLHRDPGGRLLPRGVDRAGVLERSDVFRGGLAIVQADGVPARLGDLGPLGPGGGSALGERPLRGRDWLSGLRCGRAQAGSGCGNCCGGPGGRRSRRRRLDRRRRGLPAHLRRHGPRHLEADAAPRAAHQRARDERAHVGAGLAVRAALDDAGARVRAGCGRLRLLGHRSSS